MGTRGAFGVIIGEQEKIGYNQYDSYPSSKGLQILAELRAANLDEWRKLAEVARVVGDNVRPTPEDVEALAAFTDLGVSEQSTNDWYCLTRNTHGSLKAMLECGYIIDSSTFPLDSLFCEWAYILDFDQEGFEVYEGFQKTVPPQGRWAGRPTPEEDVVNFQNHVEWCAKNGRDVWMPQVSEYKAVALVASWPLDEPLPSDEEFLAQTERELETASQD